MNDIEKTIGVFETLRKRRYRITIENDEQFILGFFPEHYHHLAGFQHLTDLPLISNPPKRREFYKKIKNAEICESNIKCSSKYVEISERILLFKDIPDILSEGEGKIIVEFDKSRLNSEISAKYYLYKRIGNPLLGEQSTYSILFIGYNNVKKEYYPATFIVDHSPRYIRNQIILSCSIELI